MSNTLRLVVMADDLTGSFDTGVQFEKRGALVGFTTLDQLEQCSSDTDVVVVDTESRHDDPAEAYGKAIRTAHWAFTHGARYLYVKTDSGLRGNVGPCIRAAMEGMRCKTAAFAPAYPAMNRITLQGRHLIDGVPVHQSAFGRDPFDPVRAETVRELIEPYGLSVQEMRLHGSWHTDSDSPTVLVFDVVRDEDFGPIAAFLQAQKRLTVTAGCAAFAACLYPFLGLPDAPGSAPTLTAPLMVVCGSVNPVAREQMLYGERRGYIRRAIDPLLLTDDAFFYGTQGNTWRASLEEILQQRKTLLVDTGLALTETAPQGLAVLRERIAVRLGQLVKQLIFLPAGTGYTPMIIGGDTLMGFLSLFDRPQVRLEGECAPGVVIFSLMADGRRVRLVSKSGGFGGETLLEDIQNSMITM